MTDEIAGASVDRLVLFRPAQLKNRAKLLRERSRHCAELASSCVTEDGRVVLEDMAKELEAEADELEHALIRIRRLFAEWRENESNDRR